MTNPIKEIARWILRNDPPREGAIPMMVTNYNINVPYDMIRDRGDIKAPDAIRYVTWPPTITLELTVHPDARDYPTDFAKPRSAIWIGPTGAPWPVPKAVR